MRAAGVPVTPGSEGNLKDLDEAVELAEQIGYPVMIKATSGGGGRGIRRCDDAAELAQAISPCHLGSGESVSARLKYFLEKCIINPRHIEVQVLADSHGNVIHLFERDCSIRRRNQKLIEIAPSPSSCHRSSASALVNWLSVPPKR